jgi:hypothetical protein
MANSSRSLIDEINTEDERCFVDNYSFMEEQKIKKALAPAQWEEMKNALAEECTKVSKSSRATFAFESEGINECSIRNLRNGKMLSMKYNPDVPCIQYTTPEGKSGHFGFRVNREGTILQIMDGQYPKLLNEIVILSFLRISR